MIDVTFTVGALDLSGLLSTYDVSHETEYKDVMTAMDGTEYGVAAFRPVISFSLLPLSDAQSASLYEELKAGNISTVYTNPYLNDDVTAVMRLTTSLDAVFGLRSIDGNRYYKGGKISLRQRTVI